MEVLLVLLVAAIAAGAVVTIYSGTIEMSRRAAERAWADIVDGQRKKAGLLVRLDDAARAQSRLDEVLQSRSADLRAAIATLTATIDPRPLSDVERQTASLVRALYVGLEAYPALRDDPVLGALLRELSQLQQNIAADITLFNRQVGELNRAITGFPAAPINRWCVRATPLVPVGRADLAADGVA